MITGKAHRQITWNGNSWFDVNQLNRLAKWKDARECLMLGLPLTKSQKLILNPRKRDTKTGRFIK
jgi:hypothetical protein